MTKEFNGLLTSRQVADITGATLRMLDHWRDRGYIVPALPPAGTGTRCGWSVDDVVVLCVLATIAPLGLAADDDVRLAIHAAAKRDSAAPAWVWREWQRSHGRDPLCGGLPSDLAEQGRVGAVLGTVEVTGQHHANDCRDERAGWGENPLTVWHCSRWADPDCWHWTLADPRPLDSPVPVRGQQGLWDIPAGVML